ncbi:MAG TPA: glucoamylase family protein [Sulfuriferula sp.]|nr:glucoamylase family protein [Sulfuriferula sp.]
MPKLKISSSVLSGFLFQLKTLLGARDTPRTYLNEEPPLRSELFSADQLEQHGKRLAATHKLTSARAPNPLLARLAANEEVLVSVCNLLTAAVAAKHRITPAGEWLLDNFYLIEEQIRTAKRHLPKAYSRELPRLAQGMASGFPRVYAIALEAIAHGDGRVDKAGFSRFVAAYQTVAPLDLGELWAIPIMLRLALIENLRRVAVRIAAGRVERNLADAWVDQMIVIAETDPKSLILLTADMARSDPPMTTPFVSEFARRLQGQGAALALPLTWIEQRLAESNQTIEQLIQSGNQQQAADQVSISNSIGSLRFLGAADWRTFVESMSLVEQTLCTDPGAAYAGMDFATRDRYRHQVEKIARHCTLSEGEVARQAIQLAAAAAGKGGDERAAHVGFYLIDQGCAELDEKVALRPSTFNSLHKIGRRFPLPLYLGAIALISLLFTGSLALVAYASGLPTWLLVLVNIAALISASQMAVALVNWLATLLASPNPLPRMDFSTGIPAAFRTLVIVPTMLTGEHHIEALIEALEVRFLANRDDNLRFGLLTDFRDAPQETLPEDTPLLQLAQARIDELNQKYGSAADESGADTFFLFHRPRRWNPQERLWMGYERKRGKLADLNSLLRGGAADCFALVVGRLAALSDVRYVITLDTDTELPRDAARQLVGAMAHPLNRPRYDERKQRVTTGYGIMQPRVSVSLPGANRSHYARLHGAEAGIDPYTRAVSDVYQDVFREGSFIGKGIYDVDAFERSLSGRFPENRILSHDLLEGCYARSGLLSDVQLYEDYPARYSADMARRHRWIRGDWQLLEWLLPSVPGSGARRQKNPLSWLSQWKLFDNLRRSLVPGALTLLLLLGWTLVAPAWLWTVAVIGILLVPSLSAAMVELFRKPTDVLLEQHLRSARRSTGEHLVQALFTLAWLPYEAFVSLDAILRTLWRMLVTHRQRLEWTPSGDPVYASRTDMASQYRAMWIAPLIAIATAAYLTLTSPAVLIVAGPILLLWFASPAIAWWVSTPLARREARLTAEQTRFLKKIARKTWAFFETFVGPEDHWLPPDNFQEYRGAALAHRTSPTNMGLALLANLTAYDFGYIPAGTLIERSANTLHTMQGMKRHRGHFYNWYDTLSLHPLHPIYISTVDSGNLAGHLMTLRPGLLALPDDKIVGARWFDGLHDTLGILMDAAHGVDSHALARLQADLESACASRPATLAAVQTSLEQLATDAESVVASLDADLSRNNRQEAPDAARWRAGMGVNLEAQENSVHPPALDHISAVISELASETDANWWAHTLARQCRAALDELTFLAPWLLLPAAPDRFSDLSGISGIPTLRELNGLNDRLQPVIEQRLSAAATAEERDWLEALRRSITEAGQRANQRIAAIEQLALQSGALAHMEYDFLYDKSRRLLAIGYNVDDLRRDLSYYDLLASEARLSNFVAIAQGQLPQESWFALGRLLTSAGGEPILLSWSGSMFEYLMPLLVMPTFENTLIDQTCKAAVDRQINYGKQRGVPWGMSESGYNTVDVHFNYQYRVFGVPGLGLKRGLATDLVVAPYASVLALMVTPEAACQNLQRLAADGLEGKFGFYEAIDYTASRQRRGESSAIIRSFMAHHQGMSFLSLAYLLLNRPMQRRFESDPLFQATMLLLQERIPRETTFFAHAGQLSDIPTAAKELELPMRILNTPDTPIPEVQLLSNGRYHVMVTNAGAGSSRWKDLAVTRWREDSTRDNWGSFCYIRDAESGDLWSATHHPTLAAAQKYEAIFSEGRAEFRRRDQGIDTHTEIVVSPEDDIELRRVSITNRTRIRRIIDVTSYAEVVLAAPAADATHPAFSNLFVQTEILAERRAILCTRRARSRDEAVPWMLHLMKVHGAVSGAVSYETDRMRFIGRCNTVADPQSLSSADATSGRAAELSGSCGSVLDPIVAIRCRITLEPNQTATIDIVSGVGESREAAVDLIEKYQDRRLASRAFNLAWIHSQVVLRQINASEADAQLYGRLASSVIYANAALRADATVLLRNHRGQSGLWGYAISGDFPIVLLQIGDAANIDLVRQLVQAHAYWRLKGLVVDLVIWNEDRAGYRQLLQEQIMGLVAAGIEAHHVMDRPGGIFVRSADQISDEDRILFQSVARAIISDGRGTLEDQLNRLSLKEALVSRHVPSRIHRPQAPPAVVPRDLILFNGLGGFTPDGKEYVITTTRERVTPAPWVNVLANPGFGTVVSENGMAYTWGENAHEFRLTPWQNDPVSDAGGEACYLRDEESGHFWSPTPLPARGTGTYVSRHGFGYSIFEYAEDGISSELTVYVALDASVKFSVLKLRNQSGRPRRLSATGYAEWVLGDLRAKSAMHVTTEISRNNGALYARNSYNTEFPDRVAFFDVDADDASLTLSGDRAEFLGRNGTLASPAAMVRARLSGKVGAALDPCAAIQVQFELGDGETREIVFRLGLGLNTDDANALVSRLRGASVAQTALEAVQQHWQHTLGAVQIETPDKSLDVLTNGWLVYQTIACRLWARTGYYQSGGAFGFRDQLQDVMALIHTQPQLMREQLLLCGSRQFAEGDVQHWWHPPLGRGVRTHCSDDYLWLPLVASRYVLGTGDAAVLDEPLRFLEGRLVPPGEDSYYDLPGQSVDAASLYQHCVRAIQHGLRFGDRGLPLMGSGDWNDGMNLVGLQGKGQSVWLGFFLCDVLKQFAKVARLYGDTDFAALCDTEAGKLGQNIEQNAWDGAWYRRAYFDDGTPLGSASNTECQIDSISQSWAVLSGTGDAQRSRSAMDAVYKRLVRPDAGLIQLLDPPFDNSELDPGYIRGYVPGVRENGGQYTHSAIWTAMAFAALGDSSRAWTLASMINPLNHAQDAAGVATYKVEPYVIAADVYSVSPHVGRGGWSWYTGSAGWMYRLIVESLLGLRLAVDKLHFVPCLPATWQKFRMHYRYRETVYHIEVLQTRDGMGATSVTLDGAVQHGNSIPLIDDHQDHRVEVNVYAA